MSFPDPREIAAHPVFFALPRMLAEGNWGNRFGRGALSRGRGYARQNRVLEARIEESGFREGTVEARVRGNRRQPYRLSLVFVLDDEELSLEDSFCSCPVGFFCKHAAAVMAKLRALTKGLALDSATLLPPELPVELGHWLTTLQLATDESQRVVRKAPSSFLAYCIESGAAGRLMMRLHRATASPKGVKVEAAQAKADPNRPAKYITEDDDPLIVRFHRLCPSDWDPEVALEGGGVVPLLEGALALDALFIDLERDPTNSRRSGAYTSYRRVAPGPDLVATPGWKTLDNGSLRPVLLLADEEGKPAGPEVRVLSTDPLRYLDPSQPVYGEIRSSSPAALLRRWEGGPAVPPEAIEAARTTLASIAPTLSPPKSDDIVRLPGEAPKPVLRIRSGNPRLPDASVVGDLRFRYADRDLVRPVEQGEAPAIVWKEGKKRMVLPRDAKAESRLGRTLADFGFEAIETRYGSIPEALALTLVPKGSRFAPADLPWADFLDRHAPDLRERGWTIEVDPEAGIEIHDFPDFETFLEPETDHGIDWFQLDLHVEIDGQRLSLIPEIARQIEQGILDRKPEERVDPILCRVPPPGKGLIRFPAERMAKLCRSIVHLLRGREVGEGPLRIDRLSAAGLADDLGFDDSETQRALARLGSKLRDIRGLPASRPPKALQAELRPYQLEGYRWLRFLAEHQLHGVLADDMGLGKTVQTLAYLAAGRRGARHPSLVVAPTSVIGNWAAECARFLPKFKVLLHHGSERHESSADLDKADLVLTSYPLLVRDRELLAGREWLSVVLDEAQYIKNPKTAAAKAACALRAEHRLCLSGTPLENHLGELWSLMRFLMPGLLGDEKTFNFSLRRPIERDHDRDAQLTLNRRVSPLILRRTKDQVATDLPGKTEILHRIQLGEKELDLYESVRALMDKRVRDAISSRGMARSHIIVLDALLKLRQVCCHPSLLKTPAATKVREASKFRFLAEELIPTLLEEGRRILLFSSFTSVLSLVGDELARRKVPHLKLTGRTRNRAALVREFQEGDSPVFLISLKAGGTGLNLTAADTVIHYDPWWNPAAENQATDRAHRIGQTRPVFVHKLICEGSIESRIVELQAHKARLVEALLSEETNKLSFDEDTLTALLAPLG